MYITRVISFFTGKFCGDTQTLPVTLVSSDSRMWIGYSSMPGLVHKGFVANYEGQYSFKFYGIIQLSHTRPKSQGVYPLKHWNK